MVLDGFGAGLALVGPVIYGTLVASGEESFDSDDGLPALAISTGVAVLLFAAIRSGFHRAARCEAAHIQYEHWYEQRTGQR
jgi:hypothetical protein